MADSETAQLDENGGVNPEAEVAVNEADIAIVNQAETEIVNQAEAETVNQAETEIVNQAEAETVNQAETETVNQAKVPVKQDILTPSQDEVTVDEVEMVEAQDELGIVENEQLDDNDVVIIDADEPVAILATDVEGGEGDAVMDDPDENHETHEGDGEHDEEDEDDDSFAHDSHDPNVMPQVNVAVLAQRKWQVKVYPLQPGDFVSGKIASVFRQARESLLYLLSPGRNARGKGEMYLSSVNQAADVVRTLMTMEYMHPEINVEIIRKNDEGLVAEKAYLRFDSQLSQVLTERHPRSRSRQFGPGRKKDRLIGSVFLKNLPPGTTKDTLRVMFPFAQEVNYNPEKFKECTARLVLKNRNHVNPCLKAFAKAELGGNVLELHPLAKRKMSRSDEDADSPDAKQRKKSEGDGGDKKVFSAPKPPVKTDKPPTNSNQNRSVLNRTRPNSNSTSTAPARTTLSRTQIRSRGYRQRVNRARQRVTAAAAAKPREEPRDRNQRRSPEASSRYSSSIRGRHDSNRRGGSRGRRSSQRRNRSDERMRQPGYRGMPGSLGVPQGLSASDVSLAASAEATKEMVLLQNQLSTAIKNQLAMLNQTTMAVEQAKRGASSVVGAGSDSFSMMKSPSHGSGPSRRSIDQYRPASMADHSERYSSRERSRPMSNHGGSYARSGSGGSARASIGSGGAGNVGRGRGGGGGNAGRGRVGGNYGSGGSSARGSGGNYGGSARGGGGNYGGSARGGRDNRNSGNMGRDGRSSSGRGGSQGNAGRDAYGGGSVPRGGGGRGGSGVGGSISRGGTRGGSVGGSISRGGARGGSVGGGNDSRRQRRRGRRPRQARGRGQAQNIVGSVADTGDSWSGSLYPIQYPDPYMAQVDYGYPRGDIYGGPAKRTFRETSSFM